MLTLVKQPITGRAEAKCAMPDDIDRRDSGVDDRRSQAAAPTPTGWQDVKTWMTAFGILLSLCGLLLGVATFVATRMLDQMKTMNANIISMDRSTSNALTLQGRDIKYLTDDQKRAWDFMRDQMAYNNGMYKAMTEMSTTMRLRGLPTPNIPDPPKLGGQ